MRAYLVVVDETKEAKAALRFKKAALTIVLQKRSQLNAVKTQEAARSAERELLDFIRGCVPPAQWLAWVTAHNTATAPKQDRAA